MEGSLARSIDEEDGPCGEASNLADSASRVQIYWTKFETRLCPVDIDKSRPALISLVLKSSSHEVASISKI